ncbi:MAG TPA: sugar phosphate isomerase/epimerase family protein [Tepidisphaeraceae bacterium]|jgi:sugar phosphate isomerase/epimerase
MNSHDDILLGTVTPFSGGGNYIRQIVPHGFESFQIFSWKNLPQLDLDKTASEIREAAGDRVISSIGMFGNPLQDTTTAEDWAKCIDNARKWFGCDLVCGFTGALDGQPIPESLPAFKKLWSELALRAEDNGVRIAFEHCEMGGTWNNAQWNIAHASTAWEMIFNEVPSPAIGLEWEPCHHLGSFVEPLQQLRKWLPKILHVHGKDATVAWDIIREHGIRSGKKFVWHRHPGFGDTNWTDVISILRMAKWRGSIDIEGWHDPVYVGDLEMTGQVHSLNYLKQCRGGPFVPNPTK